MGQMAVEDAEIDLAGETLVHRLQASALRENYKIVLSASSSNENNTYSISGQSLPAEPATYEW
jgi:hypothetical protein